MNRVRNTLAVFAFTALFGCAVDSPATTPTEQINITLHSTHTTQPLIQHLADTFSAQRPEFEIHIQTQAYQTLMTQLEDRQLDYFMTGYIPSRDDMWAAPMAQDGLVLIVHPDNPVGNLPTDQIRDIFTGQYQMWNSLEGTTQPIVTLTYPENNDVYHEFHRLVMGRQRITGNAQVVPNIEAMIQQVATSPDMIGYIPLSYLDERVKAVEVDGIAPTRQALLEHIYPLRTTIFIMGKQEPDDMLRNFFSWIQSQDGQLAVAERNFPLP